MGNLREVGVETVVIDTTGGVAYGYCVKQAATAGHVAVGDATHAFAGVCRATQATTGGNVDIGTDGVLPMRAHEAIGRLTSGNPTAVYMAASGRVMLLPGTAGTYYRVGFVHVSSADAAAQDDILYVQIAPDIVVVPSSAFAGNDCIHFDLPADLADGARFADLVVAGFDAGSPQKNAVRQGWFAGSVTQDPYRIGYLAVELAYKASKGEAVADVDTGAQWYTKDNIDEPNIALLVYD